MWAQTKNLRLQSAVLCAVLLRHLVCFITWINLHSLFTAVCRLTLDLEKNVLIVFAVKVVAISSKQEKNTEFQCRKKFYMYVQVYKEAETSHIDLYKK